MVPFSRDYEMREYEMRFREDQTANKAPGIDMMSHGELEPLLIPRAKGKLYEEGEARMF